MVHGDDKSSLQKMAYVSRCSSGLSMVVFVCLLTLPGPLANKSSSASAPILETGSMAEDSDLETPPVPLRFEDFAQKPQSFRPAMFRRVSFRFGTQREALSQACPGGKAARTACIETRHRSARKTGRQRLRGFLSRGPDPEDGRPPFVGWEGFPPTVHFS